METRKDGAQVVGAALVVGGGIAGMQAALDLAESDIKVYLLEESPWIGGCVAQVDIRELHPGGNAASEGRAWKTI